MSKKILFLNPIYTDVFDEPYRKMLSTYKEPTTTVDVISFKGTGPTHLEYNCYEALVMTQIIQSTKWAEEQGYDGIIIGCFYDPALRACREISKKMAITAPAEASLHIATTVGETISIIVGQKKWIPEMRENAHKYGYGDKVVSFRSVNLNVHQFQEDHTVTKERIKEAACLAIENDGADVIILGCTAEFGLYEDLQKELGVPVIDSGLASFKYIEFLVELNQKMNWSHSKLIGYRSPPIEESKQWGL